MPIAIKENELYREIELYYDGIKVGEAEVDLENHMLSRLCIFEPYQNNGYGTEAVNMLTEKYGLNNLWVRSDNEKAIRVYERCGYSISKTTMLEMVKRLREE